MPIGHGNRIVKPRTAKQQAQTVAYRDAQSSYASPNPPTTSWWCGWNTREELDAAVERERHRMNAPRQSQTFTREAE